MGHASITVTLDLYGHLVGSRLHPGVESLWGSCGARRRRRRPSSGHDARFREVGHEETPHAGSGIARCAGVLRARVRGAVRRRRPRARRAVRVRSRQVAVDRARRSPSSVNYLNAEVESHVADDPTDADTLAGAWQQDRWNDGGAHGNVHAFSTDGGETWTASSPLFSRCAGGTATSAVQGDDRCAAAERLPAGDGPVGVLRAGRALARGRARVRQLDAAQRGPGRVLRRRRRDLERSARAALRQSARARQQLQRQGDADGRPGRPGLRLRDLAADRLAERGLVGQGVRELGQLLLGRLVRALDRRRRDVGAGALDLPSRAVPADDRQPDRGAARC